MRRMGIVGAVVLIAAALLWLAAGATFAQTKGPIKIGFVAPVSGTFVQSGKDMADGFRMALEEAGYQAGGRKIEFMLEDTEAVPATTLTKARKLVERDGVHLLAGVFLAAEGYAIAPYAASKGIPLTMNVCSGDDLTQRMTSKWVLRSGWTSSQPMHPFGDYAYNELKYRKVSFLGPDYAFGWETIGGFQKTFEELGGKIVQKIWHPLVVQDYSPYLSLIQRDVDAVLIISNGIMAIKFFKQYEEFGLLGKIPVIGAGTTSDENVLSQLEDSSIGYMSALHYSAALDNPANKAFVKAFREKAKRAPGYYVETCYTGAKLVLDAINAIQGDVENRDKFLDALKKVELKNVPRGPMKLDAYGNPVQNEYIRKVQRVGGELQNSVIRTYENVSQFWKYRPEEFLKQPVYSRDYPPLRP